MITAIVLGDESKAVIRLQVALNKMYPGANLLTDGHFGPKTEVYVKEFQKTHNLPYDGIVGPKTMEAMGIKFTTSKLDEEDYAVVAKLLSVTPAHLKTIAKVETSGSGGFLNSDKPKILFERHYFYRLAAIPIDKNTDSASAAIARRDAFAATNPDICAKTPGGYTGGESEYLRMNRAMSHHKPAALQSASWGMFQIMGAHWEKLKYTSVDAFVRAMNASEYDQLVALARFVMADNVLWTALKKGDWVTFASRYNGPAYKKNKYDTKLAAEFTRLTVTA